MMHICLQRVDFFENLLHLLSEKIFLSMHQLSSTLSRSAYGLGPHIISPFSGAGERTEEELEWNSQMSAVRIEVEHGFAIVSNTWPFLNAGWKMHLY
jgi:hypothetical protein